MIYVGIDVAKDKHDCFITNSEGEVLFKAFTISNNLDGFNDLYQKIESTMDDVAKVKVGLEATGHYSYNLLGYLIDKGLPTYVINPLHTNLSQTYLDRASSLERKAQEQRQKALDIQKSAVYRALQACNFSQKEHKQSSATASTLDDSG